MDNHLRHDGAYFLPVQEVPALDVFPSTYMDPEVVGTMGMSSASMGMDQGMCNWGANSLITIFLNRSSHELDCNKAILGWGVGVFPPTPELWHSHHSTSWSF